MSFLIRSLMVPTKFILMALTSKRSIATRISWCLQDTNTPKSKYLCLVNGIITLPETSVIQCSRTGTTIPIS